MTLPLFLALHLVYATLVAEVMFPRMRAEGEVLGPPLLLMLAPVAVITAPIGLLFLRYAGGWFLHGALLGVEGSVVYERFHFGLLLTLLVLITACTVGPILNVAIWASRDRPRLAKAGLWLAGFITALTFVLDARDIFRIVGTNGRHLWSHPVGLLSVAAVVVLFGWKSVCQARFSDPPKQAGPGTSIPLSPLSGPWT